MKHYKTEQEFLNENLRRIFLSEDLLQEACFYWSWNFRPETRRLIWHVPNGKQRTIIEAKQLQAMGVVAGVHDMHFFWMSRLYIIELKVRANLLTKPQEQYRDAMTQQGAIFYECRSFKEWYEIINSILSQHPEKFLDKIKFWFQEKFGIYQ